MDYFEVFDLPRRLAVDTVALQARFYELSRRHHPDFHQGAGPEAQARALEVSALVNAAYRTLRDPIARVEYLIRLERGGAAGDGARGTPAGPPALLAEMFEIQEALQEARAGDLDDAGRAELRARRERLRERARAEEERLRGPLAAAWDSTAPGHRGPALAALEQALAARAYLRTVIEDLGEALGEGQETDVAHHRH